MKSYDELCGYPELFVSDGFDVKEDDGETGAESVAAVGETDAEDMCEYATDGLGLVLRSFASVQKTEE